MNSLFEEYIRKEALPTLFCPGCGNGIVQQAAIRAIDKLGIRENTALVSGIGEERVQNAIAALSRDFSCT